jgi:hypothetical protein
VKKNCILFFVCAFWHFTVTGQSVDSLVALYNARVPQEKLYIQFDNTIYAPGETVWFKAYVMEGFEPSALSKNLYIGWFDGSGKLVERTVAPIANSTAWGSYTIPQKITGNQLQVMAYTRWMLNFDSTLLFRKTLTVAQPVTARNNAAPVAPITTLRFFPEGGDMVEGLSSNIAFKAQNQGGMPVQVNGIIKDKEGNKVAEFLSQHNGMGSFELTPKADQVYTAEWTNALNEIQHTTLPVARPSGIVLKMHPTNPLFTIARKENADKRFSKLSIVAQMSQQVLYRANVDLTGTNRFTGRILTNNCPSGIMQVTVFDANREPLAERIWFVDNDNHRLNANILIDTLNTEKRGKNVYEIDIPDSAATSLSLAITDAGTSEDTTTNIISQLLLSGDIKGYVHDPAYYFSSYEDSVTRHRDLVMLTNGWRRFKWADVLNTKTPEMRYPLDTNYLSLTGKINRISDAKIKKAELLNIILLAKDSSEQFIFAPLEADGSFHENDLIVFDTLKIYYQLNKTFLPAKSEVRISSSLLPPDSTQRLSTNQSFLPDTTGLARVNFIAQERRKLDSLIKLTTLKEVVVVSKVKTRIQELDSRYVSGAFSGDNGYQLAVMDDKVGAYINIFAYLQGRVPGLNIVFDPRGNSSASYRRKPTALYLDEMETTPVILSSLPVSSIAYVKIIRPEFAAALGNPWGGLIAVYTKKGEDIINTLKGLDYSVLPGYTPIREFYSPDYGERQVNADQADLRRTLLWQPNIQTNSTDHKIRVSFYNNDISRSFRIVLEGISEDGRLLHFSKLLQ